MYSMDMCFSLLKQEIESYIKIFYIMTVFNLLSIKPPSLQNVSGTAAFVFSGK